LALAEYNGGPRNAHYFRAGNDRLAEETRAYVPKVMAIYERLRNRFEVEGRRTEVTALIEPGS
jgi:soluble lytic murein transglycosylase-like protein